MLNIYDYEHAAANNDANKVAELLKEFHIGERGAKIYVCGLQPRCLEHCQHDSHQSIWVVPNVACCALLSDGNLQ